MAQSAAAQSGMIFDGADDEREPFAAYLTDDSSQAAAQAVATQRGWSTSNIRKGGLSTALRLLGVAPPGPLHDRRHRGPRHRGSRERPDRARPPRQPGDGARHRQRRELLPPDHAHRRPRLPDEADRRRRARRDLRPARAARRRRHPQGPRRRHHRRPRRRRRDDGRDQRRLHHGRQALAPHRARRHGHLCRQHRARPRHRADPRPARGARRSRAGRRDLPAERHGEVRQVACTSSPPRRPSTTPCA